MRLMSIVHSGEPGVALDRAGGLFLLPGVSEIGPDTPLARLVEAARRADRPAVVIGRPGRRIPAERAYQHVAGLTIANDITMRDFQYRSHQWLPGKAWDGCTPVGPALVTLDEVADPQDLDIVLAVNGEVYQSSNTSRMIFDIPTIVATTSQFTRLECGDLILTGTPAGVGYRRDPQIFLGPGDQVRVTIESLGTLTNRFVAEGES